MNALAARGSDPGEAAMLRLHPAVPTPPSKPRGKGRSRGSRGRITSVRVAKARAPSNASSPATTADLGDDGGDVDTPFATGPRVNKLSEFSRAARSIMSMRKLQRPSASSDVRNEDARSEKEDPWASVMTTVVRKTRRQTDDSGGPTLAAASAQRVSLAQMLKSREIKNLVKQALVTSKLGRPTPAAPEQQSSVMEHWVKTARLRQQQNAFEDDGSGGLSGVNGSRLDSAMDVNDEDGEESEDEDGIQSGFDLSSSARTRHHYGRTLLLEESCRRALAHDGEQRSQVDLQALRAWFQMTKLKITTDFERLQPAELDLLCRRMTFVTFLSGETVFRQGDEGDGLFLVFSGAVEVRVSQRVLGELVEVTVCELVKGDYFGERSLLTNDVRAATVLAKTAVELVKITRADYNLMLKNDQLEFLSRMQLANGLGAAHSRQQTSQREYVKVLTKKKNTRSKADIDMLSEYLQTLKFFRSLPKSFVRELCLVVDVLALPAGACVFREGEVGDQFYIIFSGSVDINISSKDFRGNAQQTKLINLTEGAHFGELALMKGRGVRSATVVTREECQLLVIGESDYNSTLRRMQKKDMAKRVAVLDQIPMFQTPEWTGELLKELSYVLLEQKLATGSVLYNQGERASHVYFVVRGELAVTKEIADPFSQLKHEVFVERIGRFRVVGDDAAAGATFNEVIHREVTVSASTPVEVLLLSKYDVFHRLSRSARETLRAAAQSHAEGIVYLDRFHKTQKWESYKQKVLREHVNHERIEKILPAAAAARRRATSSTATKALQVRQATTVNQSMIASAAKHEAAERESSPPATASERVVLPTLALSPSVGDSEGLDTSRSVNRVRRNTAKHALVPANELLLLVPESKAMDKCFQPNQTIGHYVASFNADAPPTTARQTQLDAVLAAEQHRQAEILNEGNPLAYFGINLDERQQPAGWNRTTRSLVSTDALGDSKTTLRATPKPLLRHPSPTARSSCESSSVSPRALNQILHENFIFSRPVEPKTDRDPRRPRLQQMKSNQKDSLRTMTALSSKEHSPSRLDMERTQAEKLCEGDYVLLRLPVDELCGEQATESVDPPRKAATFQLLRSVRSPKAAQEVVARLRSLEQESVGGGAKYFVLQMKKFALMPRDSRSKAEEERLQSQQVDGRPNDCNSVSEGLKLESNQSAGDSTRSLQSTMGDWTTLFASFQEVLASPVSNIDGSSETGGFELKLSIDTIEKAASSSERGLSQSNGGSSRAQALAVPAVGTSHLFAVGSVVLSKQEAAQSQCDEPFLSVNALFPSEMEAMSYALSLPLSQSLNSAMLCVLPVGKWLRFEDAHDWCVQIESSRRERQERRALPSPIAIPAAAPSSPAVSSTKARSVKRAMIAPVVSGWQRDRDEGKRLHQFICARMGAPTRVLEKERIEDSGGFTPKPLASLEDKLDTLHEYLQDASTSVSSARTGLGGGVAIMKYRHVKRFGFIMRSRIAGGTHGSDGDSNAGASSPHPSSPSSKHLNATQSD